MPEAIIPIPTALSTEILSQTAVAQFVSNTPTPTTINNCVFWNNHAPYGDNFGGSTSSISANYSLISDGGCPGSVNCGAGMIYNQDPLFVSAPDDLQLSLASPGINAGSDLLGTTEDFLGNPRPYNCTVSDMGAYEYQGSEHEITCYLDADSDGFGNSAVEALFCNSCGAGYVSNDQDCDDADPLNFPTNSELCDGQDNNCDGSVDEGFDQDGDSVADCFDNCPGTWNPDQADSDCDGVGDVCDQWHGCDDSKDSDGDGTPDCIDLDEIANWVCGQNGIKVTVCHISPDNPSNLQTKCFHPNALGEHLSHGDYIGSCYQVSCSQPLVNPSGDFETEGESKNDLDVFPNPAHRILNIRYQSKSNEVILLEVLNSQGKKVYRSEFDRSMEFMTIDISGDQFSEGIYYVLISQGSYSISGPFVVMK